MELFTYDPDKRDTWSHRAFIMATATMDEQTFARFCNEKGPIRIELTFNGMEVSFVHIIERLREHFNEAVQKAAEELVEEKCSDLMEEMRAIPRAFQAATRIRLGLPPRERDDPS